MLRVRLIALLGLGLALMPWSGALAQDSGDSKGSDAPAYTALTGDQGSDKYDLTRLETGKPIDEDYIVGVGDLIQVDLGNIPGDRLSLVISPQGDITIPVAGKIKLAGLTVDGIADRLTEALTPYYRNFHITAIVLGARIQKQEVQVTGMVVAPGTYTINDDTNLTRFMALLGQNSQEILATTPTVDFPYRTNNRFRALLPEGSYRHVEIWRDNALFKTVDIAKLLVQGDAAEDVILEDGDRFHVPPIGSYVLFNDSVPFPGKVELMPGDDLIDLVRYAGGTQNYNKNNEIEVERQVNPGSLPLFIRVSLADSTIIDVVKTTQPTTGLKPSSEGVAALQAEYATHDALVQALPAEFRPGAIYHSQNGDIVRTAILNDAIYLVGAWGRPGAYAYRPDWDMLEYIGQSGGFAPGAQEGEARWIRRGAYGEPLHVEYISLKSVMLGEASMPELRPGDIIYVPTKNQQWLGPTLLNTLLNLGTQIKFFSNK
ncbi:MAG: polysaccharide biosynthesis/export family protein [bacterium]